MQALCHEDPYIKDFTAEIINILEKDSKYHIELDKTYFYQGDELQPFDDGFINSTPVINVYKQGGKIFHTVEVKPSKIHRVKCSINWNKRYDYMQQHLGQHIISYCLHELLGANTANIKLGDNTSYIDIDKVIENDDIKMVEKMAAGIIFDNIDVETLCPTKAELKKLSIKKIISETDEPIRIIKIGEIGLSVYSGMHPNSTIEVQLIKILNGSKREKGTRLEFICGSRAVSNYFSKYESMEQISKLLHCSEGNVLNEVQKLSGELNNALTEKRTLKAEVAQYQVQDILRTCEYIKNIGIIKSVYEKDDLKYISLLASKLTSFPNIIVLFGVITGDKANLIFMRSKDLKSINMNTLIKDTIILIDGKGGGSDFSAQGGGKNNNNLNSCIEYAYNRVKEYIM